MVVRQLGGRATPVLSQTHGVVLKVYNRSRYTSITRHQHETKS